MSELLDPPLWHDRQRHYGEFTDCLICARARERCRSSERFNTSEAATAAANSLNERSHYRRPVTWFSCRWCRRLHVSMRSRRRGLGLKAAREHWIMSERYRRVG